jgi:hypothetical protein
MADVLTHHNDISRTGANPAETSLTPANVNPQSFGKLFERHVDGDVYAQVLYVRGVATSHGAKNLFYVATSTNRVYAFDADDPSQDPKTPPVWSRQLDPARILTSHEICRETVGSVGITSTPVIDAQTRTMHVVTRSSTPQPGAPGDGTNFLHALDIATGAEKPSSPVRIAASLPGTGPKAGSTIAFNPRCHRNRPALLLLNGVVYLAYGTFSCDAWCGQNEPYHGWVLGYRASDLTLVAAFCTSTAAAAAGIWQSGAGPAGSSDGFVYFATGNDDLLGGSPLPGDPGNLGDSVVRLEVLPTWPGLRLAGHFTPRNAAFLRGGYGTVEQSGDTDLGSGGPTLLPGGTLVMGGKQGRIYVLDATTMALRQDKSQPSDLQPPDWQLAGMNPDHIGEGFQAFYNLHLETNPRTPRALDNYASAEHWGPNIHGNPVYWQGTGCIYHMSEKDHLKGYRYDSGTRTVHYGIDPDPVSRAILPSAESTEPPNLGMPGGACSVSANGDQDGIVWVSYPQADGQWQKVAGYLVAYAAAPGGSGGRTLVELWRDTSPVMFAKFCPPTIADGKVFRATFAPNGPEPDNTYIGPGKVVVYGLKAP